ncbi:MAG: hypothetical protein GXX96_10845 [Planctomycetaceae bacterium]|nr:hypothetical protein [Planctomycetaceae bacterium]
MTSRGEISTQKTLAQHAVVDLVTIVVNPTAPWGLDDLQQEPGKIALPIAG